MPPSPEPHVLQTFSQRFQVCQQAIARAGLGFEFNQLTYYQFPMSSTPDVQQLLLDALDRLPRDRVVPEFDRKHFSQIEGAPIDLGDSAIGRRVNKYIETVTFMDVSANPSRLDFDSLFAEQTIVHVLAIVEAYLIDALRLLAITIPGLLKEPGTKVHTRALLGYGNWETLVAHLADDFAANFATTGVAARAQAMQKQIRIIPPESNKEFNESVSILRDAGEIRNKLVHTGGLADEPYSKHGFHLKRLHVTPGKRVPVDYELVQLVIDHADRLTKIVFNGVLLKVTAEGANFDRS